MAGSADEIDALYGLIAETVEYPQDKSWGDFHAAAASALSRRAAHRGAGFRVRAGHHQTAWPAVYAVFLRRYRRGRGAVGAAA